MPVPSPRATATQRNTPPPLSWANVEEWVRLVAESVRLLFDGRINTVGELTLQTGSTTTVLGDPRIGPGSLILLTPMNADAGAETGVYIVPADGLATVHHASGGTTRTYKYAILG